MYRKYAMVRELVRTNPLPLLDLKDKELIKYANSLLPYSIGMEFECAPTVQSERDPYFRTYIGNIGSTQTQIAIKERIPGIMDIECDGSEQRFRIPSGIKGLVCLWYITVYLKEFYGLNNNSGVHYHVDMSDMTEFWQDMMNNSYYRDRFIQKNNNWVINSLKAWKYKGTYNSMVITYNSKQAVKFHSLYKTMEVRIGEMTFDYQLLFKRISNCSNIATKIRKDLLALKKAPKVEKGPKLNNTKLRKPVSRMTRTRQLSVFGNIPPDFGF